MSIVKETLLRKVLDKTIEEANVTDIHTHLFSPDFGDLLLYGIDEMLTFHYLLAETMRFIDVPYATYWKMTKKEQAELIWDTIFIRNTPYSEAARGVLTVLDQLGLDVKSRDLDSYRRYFAGVKPDDYVDKIMKMSRVETLVMTNDPFDEAERTVWMTSYKGDRRFRAALRIDALLNNWTVNWKKLRIWGYAVEEKLTPPVISEVKRFLNDWIDRMQPLYMAASLPPTFVVPEDSARSILVEECVIPVSRARNVPFAMMIGVKKLTNPDLRLAGDSVGKGEITTVEYLCAKYPENKFLITMLSRENQHELVVAARKFRNLLIFGCWWFLNVPGFIDEMTRMRLELLGSSFIPQHSDCRVMDQMLYKWIHSKKLIGDVLFDKYSDIMRTGWQIDDSEIKRDVDKLFGGNFWEFLKK
jgi:hypothetical protein